jgi:uncharacterized protein (DUF924 family)
LASAVCDFFLEYSVFQVQHPETKGFLVNGITKSSDFHRRAGEAEGRTLFRLDQKERAYTMAEVDRIASPAEVLRFWFDELTDRDWYNSTPALDQQIMRRFRATHLALAQTVADAWRADPSSRLAAVIVLDQLPRNMYRATPLAFATDGLARQEARLALETGADQLVHARQRPFFYLPFEHSEDLVDQELSVRLFSALPDADLLDYAVRHRDIVARFGRFPHRNAFLGRTSTAEEIEFLKLPGSSF